ncbi:MAG: hypothetical protein BroJett003_18720 [Planctomycetota bacterium]|nr:MAG: hypothetical protein BroJett003_18720 [Planctomycetota bacterium]
MSETQDNQTASIGSDEAGTPGARQRWTFGLALCAGLALADATLSLLAGRLGLASGLAWSASVAAAAVGLAAVFVATSSLAGVTWCRGDARKWDQVMPRLAVGLALIPALVGLRQILRGMAVTGTTATGALLLTACLALPIVAARTHAAWRVARNPSGLALHLMLRCAVAAAAVQTAISVGGLHPAWAVAIAAAAQAAAGWIVMRATNREGGERAAGALVLLLYVLFVALPAVFMLPAPRTPRAAQADGASASVTPVILLTVDTLRWDAVGFARAASSPTENPVRPLTASGSLTPNLDAFARDAIVYEQARASAPWTLPSFASIHTGLAPDVHGATRAESRVPSKVMTLAERMRESDRTTVAFGANAFLRPQSNLDQGFDTYEFYPRPPVSFLGGWILDRVLPRAFRTDVTTADLADLACGYVARRAAVGAPFFLWLHIFDPHAPYDPPAEFAPARPEGVTIDPTREYADAFRSGRFVPSLAERQYLRKLYEAEVRYVDRELGRFLDALRRSGLYDRCLIVFTSDHGEEFFEHDGFEHGHSVYDEVIRVPLAIKLPKAPGAAAGGRRVTTPVSLEQLMPTMLAWCGETGGGIPISESTRDARFSAAPEGARAGLGYTPTSPDPQRARRTDVEASSHVLPLQDGDAAAPAFSSGLLYYENRDAVVFDGFKYTRTRVGRGEALFDLAADPGEHVNLAAGRPDLLDRGAALLNAHQAASKRTREALGLTAGETITLDAETRRRLKALGYIE